MSKDVMPDFVRPAPGASYRGFSTGDQYVPQSVTFYVADDLHTVSSFEQAVLRQKLRFKPWSVSDREGMKKYEVYYRDADQLITLGYVFASIFRS